MERLDIINMALDKIGLPRSASLEDCDWDANSVYENSVWTVQRTFPWNTNQKFVKLTKDEEPPVFGYLYSYTLPEDYIGMIDIRPRPDMRSPIATFQPVGRKIYCNIDPCYCRYKFLDLDPNNWTSDLCTLIALHIAIQIAPRATQNPQLTLQLLNVYNNFLNTSMTIDSRETMERVPLDQSLFTARNKG